MKNIIIFSGGTIGREVIKLIREINSVKQQWNIIGVVDDELFKKRKKIDGIKVISSKKISKRDKFYAICAAGDPKVKKKIVKEINNFNLKLTSLLHPSLHIYKDTKILEGSIVFANSQIGHTTKLGKNVLISFATDVGHNVNVGNYTSVMPSSTIGGYCNIGENCTIGAGVNIRPKIIIEKNCILGIGTTIMQNVKENFSVVNGTRNLILKRKKI